MKAILNRKQHAYSIDEKIKRSSGRLHFSRSRQRFSTNAKFKRLPQNQLTSSVILICREENCNLQFPGIRVTIYWWYWKWYPCFPQAKTIYFKRPSPPQVDAFYKCRWMHLRILIRNHHLISKIKDINKTPHVHQQYTSSSNT